jgi:hypothetical protein
MSAPGYLRLLQHPGQLQAEILVELHRPAGGLQQAVAAQGLLAVVF